MPLVEMKSNLSFGSGNTTTTTTPSSATPSPIPDKQQIDAQPSSKAKLPLSEMLSIFAINSSTTIPTPTKPITPIPGLGVDYFDNTNALGFVLNKNGNNTTDFILNENGGPIIPQTVYYDIKGDFVSLYSPTDKAVPNAYNTGDALTPLQNIRIDTQGENQAYINYAITPNRYGYDFIPNNSEDNKYPTIRPTQSLQSRLYSKHTRGKTNIQNTGFTRNGLSLASYYSQRGNAEFGGESNRLGGANYSKIVRNIGQRWDTDGVNIPFVSDTVEAGLEFATSVLSEFGSATFGRNINTFVNTWKADAVRIGANANPFSLYVRKQNILHRKNRYNQVYSQLKGLGNSNALVNDLNDSDSMVLTTAGNLLATAANSGLLDINPQVYNPLSIFSVPGINSMMFNRNGRNFGDVATMTNQITDFISDRVLAFATPQNARLLTTAIGGFLSNAIGGAASFVGGALSNVNVGGINIGGGISSLNTNFKGFTSTNTTIKNLSIKKFKDGAVATYESAKGSVETIVESAKRARDIFQAVVEDSGIVSKTQLSKLDSRAFEDVGVDKINLISYGKEGEPWEKKLADQDALAHIPFRFTDARNGKHMIFRAILSGLTDTFSPEYASERYVGRPDSVYVYQGTSREISFTFDVYPKSDTELVTLWEKLNYLAGLTYPHYDSTGLGMIAPFSKLTIGDMYNEAPGYISSLTYAVQDNGTWEVDWAKLPKYIQVSCTFVYIGDRLPGAEQKLFDPGFIPETIRKENPESAKLIQSIADARALKNATSALFEPGSTPTKKFLRAVGL